MTVGDVRRLSMIRVGALASTDKPLREMGFLGASERRLGIALFSLWEKMSRSDR